MTYPQTSSVAATFPVSRDGGSGSLEAPATHSQNTRSSQRVSPTASSRPPWLGGGAPYTAQASVPPAVASADGSHTSANSPARASLTGSGVGAFYFEVAQ